MQVEGKLEKDRTGGYSALVPSIGVFTQGESITDAYEMVKDAIESLDDDGRVRVSVSGDGKRFFIAPESGTFSAWMAFILRRMRMTSGKSLEDVRTAIGASSRSAYARYESGDVVPSVEKFGDIVKAISGSEIVLLDFSTGERLTGEVIKGLKGGGVVARVFGRDAPAPRVSAGIVVHRKKSKRSGESRAGKRK